MPVWSRKTTLDRVPTVIEFCGHEMNNIHSKAKINVQDEIKRMAPLSFRSSDYIFAQIALIQFNELFIMNLSSIV